MLSRFFDRLLGKKYGEAPMPMRVDPSRQVPVNNEFAIIGLGRFGSSLGLELLRRGFTVLGIDSSMDLVQKYSDQFTQTIQLDATNASALREVEITAYDAVIVAIGANFEASLMTTVALKKCKVKQIICKASTDVQRDLLLSVGAQRVLLPEHDSGQQLAAELAQPALLDEFFLESNLAVGAMAVPDVLVGENLASLRLSDTCGLQVLGVYRDGKIIGGQPDPWMLEPGDAIIVAGDHEGLRRFGRS